VVNPQLYQCARLDLIVGFADRKASAKLAEGQPGIPGLAKQFPPICELDRPALRQVNADSAEWVALDQRIAGGWKFLQRKVFDSSGTFPLSSFAFAYSSTPLGGVFMMGKGAAATGRRWAEFLICQL